MSSRTCPFCGAELKAEIFRGLCPRCVLLQTMANEAPPPAPSSLNHGHPFGDYELLEEIACGGMGDMYALGAMLYHLLTGRPPFQADSLTTLLRQVIEAEPVAPRILNPSIPRDLETICSRSLEKDRLRRYATAEGLADELGRVLLGFVR